MIKKENISKDMEEAVDIAIEMEEDGYSFYMGAAHKTKNNLGRSTLEAIAERELVHKKIIENYFKSVGGSDLQPFSGTEQTDVKRALIAGIFSAVKDTLDSSNKAKDDELVNAYNAAMELEKKAHEFYKKLAGETNDPGAKKMFLFLQKEENAHYEIFQESHLYLSSPAEWFHQKENWLMEG